MRLDRLWPAAALAGAVAFASAAFAQTLPAASQMPPPVHPATQPAGAAAPAPDLPDDPEAATLTVPLGGREESLRIVKAPQGHMVIVHGPRGDRALTAEEFLDLIYEEQRQQRGFWLFRVLNITSWFGLLWVSIGLAGQAMFTFRMVLQWLASEKARKSVVPVGFWWGSLIGGLMLLSYFLWRKDIVGIIGQATGVFIYARNLALIYRSRAGATAAVDPAAEPELADAAAPRR